MPRQRAQFGIPALVVAALAIPSLASADVLYSNFASYSSQGTNIFETGEDPYGPSSPFYIGEEFVLNQTSDVTDIKFLETPAANSQPIDWLIYTANGHQPSTTLVASGRDSSFTTLPGSYGQLQLTIADVTTGGTILPAGAYFAILHDESTATDFYHVPNWYLANSGTGGLLLEYNYSGNYYIDYYENLPSLTMEVDGTAAAVPEPDSIMLFAAAVAIVCSARLRRPVGVRPAW